MKIHKRSLQLALKNSAVMALLVLAVLGLFGKHISEQNELTPEHFLGADYRALQGLLGRD